MRPYRLRPDCNDEPEIVTYACITTGEVYTSFDDN